jgi:hypothetical protein
MSLERAFLAVATLFVIVGNSNAYARPGGRGSGDTPDKEIRVREPHVRARERIDVTPHRAGRSDFERATPEVRHGVVVDHTPQSDSSFHLPQYRTRNGTVIKPVEVERDGFHFRPWVERTGEDPPRSSSPGATITYDGPSIAEPLEGRRWMLPTAPLPRFGPQPLNLPILPRLGPPSLDEPDE